MLLSSSTMRSRQSRCSRRFTSCVFQGGGSPEP
jgi:hypothetical protein